MTCPHWHIVRRPEYREDLDAIEARIAGDNPSAAIDMWLLVDQQVGHLADPNFPRRPNTRVPGAHEVAAHENYTMYFNPRESDCTVTVRAVVHVAREVPGRAA